MNRGRAPKYSTAKGFTAFAPAIQLTVSTGRYDVNHILPGFLSCLQEAAENTFDSPKGHFQTNSFMAIIDTDLLLSWGATFKKVKKGEVIFREGAQASFYHQLEEGKVRWVNIDDEGREFIQCIIEKGESFGEPPMFDDGPYAATAIAEEDSIVIRLLKTSFIQLLKENPEIHFAFSRILTERLRFRFMIAKELAFHNPEQRICAILDHYKKKNPEITHSTCLVKLTRQQIADMTGLRVETVIRTIRNLYDRGSLLIERGKIYC